MPRAAVLSRLAASADCEGMNSVLIRVALVVACVAVATLTAASPAMAARVEVLAGPVTSGSHKASGRAAVVATGGGRRVLTLRKFRLAPGPRVRVWLVPRDARSDNAIPRDRVDLGALKGSRGNQQYTIPASTDLRRYSSVVFWCVPFTSALARADLRRS